MAIEWVEKMPTTNFRNQVVSMVLTASKTLNGKTATTGAGVAFGPNDIKDASYWTDEKIDEFANEQAISSKFEESLDAELALAMQDD
jgi:hypothetical protein